MTSNKISRRLAWSWLVFIVLALAKIVGFPWILIPQTFWMRFDEAAVGTLYAVTEVVNISFLLLIVVVLAFAVVQTIKCLGQPCKRGAREK